MKMCTPGHCGLTIETGWQMEYVIEMVRDMEGYSETILIDTASVGSECGCYILMEHWASGSLTVLRTP